MVGNIFTSPGQMFLIEEFCVGVGGLLVLIRDEKNYGFVRDLVNGLS